MKRFFSDDTFFIRYVCYGIGLSSLVGFLYQIFS